jgi:monoamine oxidase
MIDRTSLPLRTGSRPNLDLDVAIVGAGVSGLYSGYRLLGGEYAERRRAPTQVHVFEMSPRIGGRLHSVSIPGMDVVGELGGMRYLTSQALTTTLIEQVFADRLQTRAFSMGDPGHLFFYLRGQRFRANAWSRAQARGRSKHTRYRLHAHDAALSPDQLFNRVIYDVLMADRQVARRFGHKLLHPSACEYDFRLTRRDWAAIKPVLVYNFPGPYAGMRVADMGFWNLIRDRCSDEGYDYLSDGNGYYSMTINWNAAEAFPYTVGDFSGKQVSYKTIDGGYDQIAYALAQAFTDLPGSAIWTGNRLVDLARADGGARKYVLTFQNQRSSRPWRVFADRVVLAMPRRSLELLNQQNFFFNPPRGTALHEHMRAALLEPSFKLLLGFKRPWWKEDFGALAGESITDLPMRQCYYFGTDPANSHSLFMASYNDMRTVGFWTALEKGPRFVPRRTRLASDRDLGALRRWHASQLMVAEAMGQVRQVHGHLPRPIPDPYVALYMNWSDDPFGAGYHGWAAGAPVKRVMRYMRQPYAGEQVHICGEAYSEQQGWVEGALCVAERMLQEHFALRWPRWLARDYFLGW